VVVAPTFRPAAFDRELQGHWPRHLSRYREHPEDGRYYPGPSGSSPFEIAKLVNEGFVVERLDFPGIQQRENSPINFNWNAVGWFDQPSRLPCVHPMERSRNHQYTIYQTGLWAAQDRSAGSPNSSTIRSTGRTGPGSIKIYANKNEA